MVDKTGVGEMFNNISSNYDKLNFILSFGIDDIWRKKLIKELTKQNLSNVLDIATGTGDLALSLAKKSKTKIIGIDIAEDMLKIAQKKISDKNKSDQISLKKEDVNSMSFSDETFDAAMISFGIRNFIDINTSLKEIKRVLKKDGYLYILELSKPNKFPFKQLFSFYSMHFIPMIGKIISKNNNAYKYLPLSIAEFTLKYDLNTQFSEAGYKDIKAKNLTFGVCKLYICKK